MRAPVPLEERCCGRTLGFHSHRCPRRATVTRDGKGYCKQHDPVRIAERVAARDAKWAAERAEQQRQRAAEEAREAHRDRCEALVPELVEALRQIVADCEAEYPPSHGAIKHFARVAIAKAKDANT